MQTVCWSCFIVLIRPLQDEQDLRLSAAVAAEAKEDAGVDEDMLYARKGTAREKPKGARKGC